MKMQIENPIINIFELSTNNELKKIISLNQTHLTLSPKNQRIATDWFFLFGPTLGGPNKVI